MLDAIFRPNGERRQVEAELRDLLVEVREEREAAREEREAVREEREAFAAEMAKNAGVLGKLARTNKTMDEVSAKADAVMRKVEGLAAMGTGQDEHARRLDEVREVAGEARADAQRAAAAAKDVAARFDSLAQWQESSKDAERRIASLHALAEHVSLKTKALESQRHVVDHAAAETARPNDLVGTMETQLARFAEGREQLERAEDAVSRIGKLARDATQDLSMATAARELFARESARQESQGRTLLETLRSTAERLAVDKEEFGAFDERLKSLSAALAESEARMQAVQAKDELFVAMQHKADSLAKVFADMRVETEDLARKQSALDDVTEQMRQVESLGWRTAAQHDSLLKAQGDLVAMHAEMDELQKSYGEASRLRERLMQDRSALEAFAERTSAMIGRTPEIEARLEAMLGKMALLEEGNESHRRLGLLTSGLDAELMRMGGRMQFVEKVEERMNALYALSTQVEHKVAEQATRRAEIEGLAQHCDSLGTQITYAQQQLEGVLAQQGRLLPLAAEVSALGEALRSSQATATTMKKGEAAALEQQARLAGLIEHGMRQAAETTDRLRQVQGLGQDLTQVAARSDEVMAQLTQVQARQRDVLAQVSLTEDQMQRAEAAARQLDHRRSLLVHTEKSLASFEARLADLDHLSEGLDAKMRSIVEREALVLAVKAEVDGIGQISSRSKADLQFVAEHRSEVIDLRGKIDSLIGRIADTDDKMLLIESWRKKVEEAQASAHAVTALLSDVQGTLEDLSEQRVVIDDVGDKLARLDFTVQEAQSTLSRLDSSAQEAQNTLRTLQREREVAERVEKSIKAVRAGSGRSA